MARFRELSQLPGVTQVSFRAAVQPFARQLGLGLGVALQHGLRSQGLKVLSISWPTIIVMLVVSAVVGILAAVLPAVRAVRLNILTAIAADG